MMAVAARRPLPRPMAPPLSQTNHTAGIYADMTVDGPEIGTLVVVVDRAKNLPNLRTMGKQDPYCAARLAKEAKKTDTDKRGGQTPRWDQELRFVVRDSPDYHKLKVSVFNDDKKTDLIGETWVNLEDLLKPGGGQGDDWHPLNIKGRYAGEIRMELTFYDSRPKVESDKRKRSNTNSTQASSTQLEHGQSRPAGPQPMNRRPLPPDPAASTANLSMDSTGPPNHNLQHLYGIQDIPPIPQPMPHSSRPNLRSYHPLTSQRESGFQQSTTHNMAYYPDVNDYPSTLDDPYTQHNADQSLNFPQELHISQISGPPKHDRVHTLSGSPNSRPLPPYELPHAHSAPELGPEAHSQPPPQFATNERNHFHHLEHYGSAPVNDSMTGFPRYATQPPDNYNNHDQVWLETSQGVDDNSQPPPPPVHRNSAPAISSPHARPKISQQTSDPSRALHIATNASNAANGSSSFPRSTAHHAPSISGYGSMATPPYPTGPSAPRTMQPRTPLRNPDVNRFQYHLSHSADQSVRPRNEMASDPRLKLDEASSNPRRRPQSYQETPSFDKNQPMDSPNVHDNSDYQNRDTPNIIRPQPISPGAQNLGQGPSSKHHTPRKSVGAAASPADSQNSTPYSPDSFDLLNPHHSTRSTPTTLGTKKDEPVPMYSSPSSSPTKPQLQNSPSSPDQQIDMAKEPIIGSDGRVKDPSDHLPPSSYAPEPERKGNRPSTVVNIKSRFGPRQAPLSVDSNSNPISLSGSSPISTGVHGLSASNDTPLRPPRTSTGQYNSASSPLSPTQSNILNMSTGSYNLSSPYPPPVPGKIPLGGYQRQVDEHDHFEMAALSLDSGKLVDPHSDDTSRKARRSRWAF